MPSRAVLCLLLLLLRACSTYYCANTTAKYLQGVLMRMTKGEGLVVRGNMPAGVSVAWEAVSEPCTCTAT